MDEHTPKVAVITGAGSGIGREIALQLAKDGFDLAINDILPDFAQNVAKEVESLGVQSFVAIADVSDETQVNKMMQDVYAKYGRIDVLVNNAGICQPGSLFDIKPEDMLHTYNINVVSILICVKAAAKYMMLQGKGKIINAASQSSFRQVEEFMDYNASKWAVRGFTRSLALFFGKHNITVNAYCPGTVISDMQDKLMEKISEIRNITVDEYQEVAKGLIPLGRFQPAEDIAKLVSFLASDAADNITGQNIMVNGGQVMC